MIWYILGGLVLAVIVAFVWIQRCPICGEHMLKCRCYKEEDELYVDGARTCA